MKVSSATVLLFTTAVASAARDSNYYPWGTNVNAEAPMFWNDAVNVLQDLTQFQALYIKYHSCVWSPYASGSDSNMCTGGSGANDDQYWYVGNTPCYRANAAFSLYGVLVPEVEEATTSTRHLKRTTSMCNELTYINSFFTTYGATTISTALGIVDETGYATMTCSSSGNNNNNNNNNGGNDKNGNNNNAVSVTMGCESGRFVHDSFQGKYCDGNRYLSTDDTMDTYNQNMEGISCTQIWDYDTFVGSHRELGGYGSLAETILYYSKSCSVSQYPGVCPDPYGVKTQYSNPSTASKSKAYHSRAQRTLTAFSWVLLAVGITLMFLSVMNMMRKKRLLARRSLQSRAESSSLGQDDQSSIKSKISRSVSNLSRSASKISVKSMTSSVKGMFDGSSRDNAAGEDEQSDAVLATRGDSNLSAASTKSASSNKSAGSNLSSSVKNLFTMPAEGTTVETPWASNPNRYQTTATTVPVASNTSLSSQKSGVTKGSSKRSAVSSISSRLKKLFDRSPGKHAPTELSPTQYQVPISISKVDSNSSVVSNMSVASNASGRVIPVDDMNAAPYTKEGFTLV